MIILSMLPSQISLATLGVLADQAGLEVHWPQEHQGVPVDPVTCSKQLMSFLEVPCNDLCS